MEKFKMEKSADSNIYKSIRFPNDLNTQINQIVSKANEGKAKKEYSFNGFVISACRYALQNMD